MADFFDNEGFNEYYLNYAKSPDKQKLLNAFYWHWQGYFGDHRPLRLESKSCVKASFKDQKARKAIKDRLMERGFTSSTIDGLFKKFDEWNKKSK